jgi:hypothetical protein
MSMTDATTIVFHLGAPNLNMDTLTSSLRKDNILLSEYHTMARRPGHYRGNLHNRLMEIEIDGEPGEPTESFLAKLCQQQTIKRLLLSDGSFLGPLEKIVTGKGLYASAADQIKQISGLFPDNPCEFFLEIRDPATFFPEISAILDEDINDFAGDFDVENIRWSKVVQNIQNAAPDSAITVWQHENTPLVWPEILRAVSGVGQDVAMDGDLDQALLAMPDHAGKRLAAFISDRPELTFKQRRHVMKSFLDAALPVKDNSSVLSGNYESDLTSIRAMAGVTLIE